MGCGSSTMVEPVSEEKHIEKNEVNHNEDDTKANGDVSASPKRKHHPPDNEKGAGDSFHKESIVKSMPPKPVKKSIAFDVGFDNNNIDKIISRHPPKRLQHLEPIHGANTLTAEALAEKQRLADEKRQQELNKKKQKSVQSQSRLHRHLQAAKQYEREQLEQRYTEVQEKQVSAGKNRLAKLKEQEDKQKRRKEHAQLVRERARRMKNEEDVDFDMEKDETYNEDEDSWLNGENNTSDYQSDNGDRIYSGRESPSKPCTEKQMRPNALSASTTDSFDYAFQRTPVLPQQDSVYDSDPRKDDFFDS